MDTEQAPDGPVMGVSTALPQQSGHAPLLAILDRLQHDADMIAGRTADLVMERIPAYVDIPWHEVHAQVVQNTRRAVRSLRDGAAPRAADVSEASIAAKRASQGVPVQDVLQAYRISLGVIRDQFLLLAGEEGAPTDVVVRGIQLLWEVTDVVTLQLAVRHQEAEVRAARRDERQRLDFLHRLLTGSLSPAELRSRAPRYGLSPDRSYVVLRGRATQDSLLASLKRVIEATGDGRPTLVGLVDGDVAALACHAPEIGTLPVTVGVGHPRGLIDVPAAWEAASRTLDTAYAFGLAGSHTLEDLSLRSAVAEEHELGTMLVERYLGPLADDGEFGRQVEQSLRTFLKYGMNIARAARALAVHPNTLRHRLRRFKDKTGANFEDPRTLVEVWWALERRTWMSRTGAPAQAGAPGLPPAGVTAGASGSR